MESGTSVSGEQQKDCERNAEKKDAARIARSFGWRFGECDHRSEREKRREAYAHSRELARMNPEERKLEMARIGREKRAGVDVQYFSYMLRANPGTRPDSARKWLSEEMRKVDTELVSMNNRAPYTNDVGAGDARSADAFVARRRAELIARRNRARALSSLEPEDLVREITRENRAKRSEILVLRRKRRGGEVIEVNEGEEIAEIDGGVSEGVREDGGSITPGGLASAENNENARLDSGGTAAGGLGAAEEFRQKQFLLGEEGVRALAGIDSPGMVEDFGRGRSGERHFAGVGGQRIFSSAAQGSGASATSERGQLQMDWTVIDGVGVSPSSSGSGLGLSEAYQEGPKAIRDRGRDRAFGGSSSIQARQGGGIASSEHNQDPVGLNFTGAGHEGVRERFGRDSGGACAPAMTGQDGHAPSDLDMADPGQEEVHGRSTRDSGRARALAETRALAKTDRKEIKREAPWGDGEVVVEIRVHDVEGGRAAAGEASAANEKQKKLLNGRDRQAHKTDEIMPGEGGRKAAVGDGAGDGEPPFAEARLEGLRPELETENLAQDVAEVERKAGLARAHHAERLRTGGRALMDGVVPGDLGRKEAVGDGGSASLSPFVETRPEGSRVQEVAGVGGVAARYSELQTGGNAITSGVGPGEVDHNAAVGDGTGASGFPFIEDRLAGLRATQATGAAGRVAQEIELQMAGRAPMGGVGAGKTGRTAAVVDDAGGGRLRFGAGGFPFIEARPDGIRDKAVVGAAERMARGAAEVHRKADLAQARRAERLQIGGRVLVRTTSGRARTGQANGKVLMGLAGGRKLVGGVWSGGVPWNAAAAQSAGAGGLPSIEARLKGLRTKELAEGVEMEAWGAAGVKRKGDLARAWDPELLMGGRVRIGDVDADNVHGGAVAVEGAGANGFRCVGARLKAIRAKAASQVAEKVARDAARVKEKADLMRDRHAEMLQTDGRALMGQTGRGVLVGGAGAAKGCRRESVVDGVVGGGFPFVEDRLRGLRDKAVAKRAERAARDAAKAKRKGDRARARHSERARRLEEKQRRKERRASRDAKRHKKLRDREIRAKSKAGGEGLRPPVEILEALERDAVEEEGGGMLTQEDVQEEAPSEAVSRRQDDTRSIDDNHTLVKVKRVLCPPNVRQL